MSLSPMSLRKRIHDSEILLDLAASDLPGLVGQAVGRLAEWGKISPRERAAIDERLEEHGPGVLRDLGGGVGVLRLRYPSDVADQSQNGDRVRCALIRVPDGVRASDYERIHFLWLLIAPDGAATPLDEELEPFGWMLHDDRFNASILGANDPMQVLATYQLYLEYVEAPPDVRRPDRKSVV